MTTTTTKTVGGTSKPAPETPAAPVAKPAETPVEKPAAKPAQGKKAAPPAAPKAAPVAVPQPEAPKPAPTNRATTVASNDDAAKKRYADEEKAKAKVDKPFPDAETLQASHQPTRGPLMIVIDGAGTMPLIDNNGRRVMRGQPVEVSEAEVAWLASTNSGFKRV